MDKNEVQALARVRWETAAERISLELAPPDGEVWDEQPRDLKAAVELARAALDAIEAAYGLDKS